MLTTSDLFDLENLPEFLKPLFEVEYPWEILAKLDDFAKTIEDKREGDIHPTAVLEGNVWLEPGAKVKAHALIEGPAYIMSGAEVGHGAYIRGGVFLGEKAKVGHATEGKRSILLGDAKAPHFNYVGDSILGHSVNIGAGVKLANFITIGQNIKVGSHPTGLRKFGSAIGDNASVGCNAVLNPGTVVGQNTLIYGSSSVRGVVAANAFVKLKQNLKEITRRKR